MRSQIAEMVDAEAEPPEVEDFGFLDPDDRHIFETCQIMVHHHILPRAGGWDDQEMAWRIDAMTWLSLYARAKWEYWEARRESGRSNNSGGGDFDFGESSQPATHQPLQDWRTSLIQHHG